jgi:hypothetical protein
MINETLNELYTHHFGQQYNRIIECGVTDNDVEGDICLDVGCSVAVTLLIVLRKDSFPHVDRALFILLQSLQ